jgi:hypothetical protein
MHINVSPRRAVFVFPVMKQNICGHKFEDGGKVAKIFDTVPGTKYID